MVAQGALTRKTDMTKLEIDVISDVVCPWCFLGKRKLDAAMKQVAALEYEVRWRPFQLDPTIPPEGLDRQAYMARKFGPEKIAAIHTRLEEAGREEGVAFAFDKIVRSPNTLDAHRLIRWSQGSGRQGDVVDRLFNLYFCEGADIGDRAVLVDVAREMGLDTELIARLLTEGVDVGPVREEIATAARMGVSGVPFFIFNGKYAVSGAQPADALVGVIWKVGSESE
jgi:predicted DsbA family dithiol-disulfide isomerase